MMDGQAPESAEPRKIGRRAMLLGGVAAVAGGALAKTRSAIAAGVALILGQSNFSPAPTSLQMGSPAPPQSAAFRADNLVPGGGIGLIGAVSPPPLALTMTAGLVGFSGGAGGGVVGIAGGLPGTPFSTANVGVSGLAPGGTGVQGLSDAGTGVAGGGRTGIVGKANSGPGVGGLMGPAGVAGWGPPGDGAAVIGVGGGFFSPGGVTVTASAGVVGVSPSAGLIGLVPEGGGRARIAVHGGFLDPAGAFVDPGSSGVVAGVVGTSPLGQGIGVIGAGGGFGGGPIAVTMTAAFGVLGIGPTAGIVGAARTAGDPPVTLDVSPAAGIGIVGLGRLVASDPVTATADIFIDGRVNTGVLGLSSAVGVFGASRSPLETAPIGGLGDRLRAGIVGTFGHGGGPTITANAGIAGISSATGVIGLGGPFGGVAATMTAVEVTGRAGLVGISEAAGVAGFLHSGDGQSTASARFDIPTGFAVVGMVGNVGVPTMTSGTGVGVLGASRGIGLLGIAGMLDAQLINPTITAGVFGMAAHNDGTGVHAANYSGGFALDVAGRARFSTTGVGTVPTAVDTLFVNDPSVSASSLVLVSLTDDPGKLCTLQWVETVPGLGFTLHLQGRTRRPATFAYVVLDR